MKVFSGIVALLLASAVMAQEANSSKKNFKGGLIAGGVTTQISGDGLGGWDKFGLAAGAWVQVPLSERTSATMSIQYINKGSKTVDTLTHNMFGYYLNYFEVPVWFSYAPSKKDPDKLVINFGPYAGYLFSQKKIEKIGRAHV